MFLGRTASWFPLSSKTYKAMSKPVQATVPEGKLWEPKQVSVDWNEAEKQPRSDRKRHQPEAISRSSGGCQARKRSREYSPGSQIAGQRRAELPKPKVAESKTTTARVSM